MRIIKTKNPFPSDTLGQLALYNGMDNLSLFEILEGIKKEFSPEQKLTYKFEMSLQSALIEMELNGVLVDQIEKDKRIRELLEQKKEFDSLLHQLCEAVGYYDYYKSLARLSLSRYIPDNLPNSWAEWLATPVQVRREWKRINEKEVKAFCAALKEFEKPFNAGSPKQKLRLLYHFFGIEKNSAARTICPDYPPVWQTTKGIVEVKERKKRLTGVVYTPSTDRGSLEKIRDRSHDITPDHAGYWARPFIQLCLALADINKSLGFLNCRLEDGWFKSSFSCVTETGRLASRKNAEHYGSNGQNIAPKHRAVLTVPLGYKLSASDYGQIESRCVAARCFVQFGAVDYYNAGNCGDLHSLASSLVWPNLPWPEDFNLKYLKLHGPFPKDMIKAAREIAEVEFYRGKSRRDVTKTLSHGTSYMGRPPQMHKHSHIDIKLIEHFQEAFFNYFPEIKLWHNWIIEQVQVYGKITTILGRTRQFFGRPSDDATLREAVAFDPQSFAADYTNNALLNLQKISLANPGLFKLQFQKHDELSARFLEKDEEQVMQIIRETMEYKIPLVSPTGETREWFVPVDSESGWNLGRFHPDENPNGLAHFPMERERIVKKFSIGEMIC